MTQTQSIGLTREELRKVAERVVPNLTDKEFEVMWRAQMRLQALRVRRRQMEAH